MPVIVIVLLVSIVLTTAVFFTAKLDTAPIYYPIYSFIGFVMSILWIYVEANESKSSIPLTEFIFFQL